MVKRRDHKHRIAFLVTFELPEKATVQMARMYLESAISAERGLLDLDHPMTDFKRSTLEVHRYQPSRSRRDRGE